MSINLYKKKTINNQPVLEELLSKSTDTVADKPLVYDSTNDNVKSTNDLCVDTVTANCFCGKATCADIADVACTVCVNGVSGLRPILTLGSDGKVYNTGDNVQAGSRCMVTPLVSTNYIYACDGNNNNLMLLIDRYDREEEYYPQRLDITYTPSVTTAIQCNADCHSGSRFSSGWLGDLNSHGICMCSWDDSNGNASQLFLGKDCTCYCRHDYNNNNVYSEIMTTCAGEISLDIYKKSNYGGSILGQGCLDLGICGNTLYSKSCINDQYNYLVQDCGGTLICFCCSSSSSCPTTLHVGYNVINTCVANSQRCSNICQSYSSIKSNVCYGTEKGIVALDNNSFDVTVGDSSECSCFIVCRDGAVFSHTLNDTTSISRIVGSQFLGNALTATNATNADNSICFNNCTYAEACIDIRDGLATQTCVNAVQNCADFIQSCVTAIESKIPAQASASNQLADKDFVNSSITTNTANFRGTYACAAELPTTGNTNNDYAFVCSLNTTTGNYVYDRYKWVASNSCWVCEYELNTTGFTAEQLASINSGITDTLVAKITDVYDNTIEVCMNGACKGSFNLNQNTDACIDLGCDICNAKCFDGCTYACAKADIRNGLISDIGVKVYCDATCKCTLAKTSDLCLSANAFNSTINMNCVDNATSIGVAANNITRKAIVKNSIINVGYITSAAIGLCRGTSGWGKAMISVSCNYNATSWQDYCFDNTGIISAPNLKLQNTNGTNAGVCLKVGSTAANTDRNILLTPAVPGNDSTSTGEVQVSTACPLTFNPSTGVLCAKCFCGSVTASGQIDCSIAIKRYQATTGDCHIALFNSNTAINDACAYVSSVCPLTFNPSTGVLNTCTLCSGTLDSCNIRAEYLVACSSVYLGDECDICIYDRCGHDFICGYNCSLTIGYGSGSFTDSDCCRITVGLDNCMCLSGNNSGESVVIGVCNKACWTSYDYVSIIYGCSNVTRDGGLAVGGWNYASGACSVVLGWNSNANSFAIAIGCDACAGNLSTIAIGNTTCATANGAIAIGLYAQSCICNGLAIGRCSYTCSYSTACVNSNIRKGPLREITITWCDSTLKCDIWKAIANNIDLRKNGKGTVLTSGCTYLSATGYIGSNKIPIYACNYNYNSSLATMCSIVVRDSGGSDIMTISATCTAAATDAAGGGFLTITGWAK